MAGIFNPNASIFSDLSLIVNWIVFIGLIIAWYLAYRHRYDSHHRIIWGLLILNFLTVVYMDLQLFAALPSLVNQPEILPFAHSMLGALIFLLALYTTLLMSFPNRIPEKFRVKNTFRLMRITAVLWMALVVSGTLLYLTWYPF